MCHLDDAADFGDGLTLAISCLEVLSLLMICSGVCLGCFIVESPAQFGRIMTFVHRGPMSEDHVSLVMLLDALEYILYNESEKEVSSE